MQNLGKLLQNKKKNQISSNIVMDFITIGVGCNCLVSLYETGVWNKIIENNYIADQQIEKYKNSICIKSALVTLEKCNVVKRSAFGFEITEFGKVLSEYLGLVTIFFDGYGNLIAKQSQISKGKIKNQMRLIKGSAVSRSSVLISEKMTESLILDEFSSLKLSGTICDLGCGYATTLSKICKKTGNFGLGIDSEPKVVRKAKKRFENTNITVELGDIAKLQGIWEDVVVLTQCHVLHDFTPEQKCIDIMNSYLNNFPNMKCFFYVDIVSPSDTHNRIMPGFDYVHGLLGIQTRTYEETIQMFKCSNYKVIKEVLFPDMPNTFLWILVPK
jgi:SAM-dependent methyltransferase